MSIIDFIKCHFLTKTQYDELISKPTNNLYFVEDDFIAETTAEVSTELPTVVTSGNLTGDTWYRKWSDGWIEQGGKVNVTNGYFTNVVFPVRLLNRPIKINVTPYNQPNTSPTGLNYLTNCVRITEKGFQILYGNSNSNSDPYTGYATWVAYGYYK